MYNASRHEWPHKKVLNVFLRIKDNALFEKDNALFEKFNRIWNKVSNSIKKGFHSESVHYEKYLRK